MTFEEWYSSEGHILRDMPGSLAYAAWSHQEEKIAQLQARLESEEAHYTRLYEQHKKVQDALSCSRAQWIHSVNATQCLEALDG